MFSFFKSFFKNTKPKLETAKSILYRESGRIWHSGGILAIDLLPNGQFIITKVDLPNNKWIIQQSFSEDHVLKFKTIKEFAIYGESGSNQEKALREHLYTFDVMARDITKAVEQNQKAFL